MWGWGPCHGQSPPCRFRGVLTLGVLLPLNDWEGGEVEGSTV
jgi:hypothetical protein